jgi:hypothetical protein
VIWTSKLYYFTGNIKCSAPLSDTVRHLFHGYYAWSDFSLMETNSVRWQVFRAYVGLSPTYVSWILWRIRAMEGTPSPASDDVATERCRCYGNGQVNTRPLPSTTVTLQRFPLWHNTRHRCWLRQQATGNGIKSRRSSMWSQSVNS